MVLLLFTFRFTAFPEAALAESIVRIPMSTRRTVDPASRDVEWDCAIEVHDIVVNLSLKGVEVCARHTAEGRRSGSDHR
jgi:hypothetical protein